MYANNISETCNTEYRYRNRKLVPVPESLRSFSDGSHHGQQADGHGAHKKVYLVVTFDYDEHKNEWLLRERDLSFEDVIVALSEGRLLADYMHPNQKKYPGQRIMVVNIHNYSHCVPYVVDGEIMHMMTVYASRKFLYLLERQDHESG